MRETARSTVPEEGRRGWRWPGGGVAWCRRRFPLAARYAAVNGTTSRQERPTQEGGAASGAAEASLGRVPVLTLVRHLALVDADRLAAAVAVLGEGGVEAPETVRPALPHHVPLAAELRTEKDACVSHEFTNRSRRWIQIKQQSVTRMNERTNQF
jgi:hypothetical protein